VKKLFFALALLVFPVVISILANGCSKGATQPQYDATSTPSFTFTTTPLPPTQTATNSPTHTATSTPTNTSTVCQIAGTPCTSTSTFTPTSTPTITNTPTPLPGWHFDSNLQTWSIGYNPASLATQLVWDAAVGNPAAGSASLYVPFSGPSNQQITFSLGISPTDMTGKTFSAMLRLDSGMNSNATYPGNANIYLKSTGAYIYGGSLATNLDSTSGSPTWVTLTLNADSPNGTVNGGYTPTDIREIGIQINTSSTGSGTYVPAIFHIDEFIYY